ncbi:hypothetical protein ACNKHP_21665 [Shigella boydii]
MAAFYCDPVKADHRLVPRALWQRFTDRDFWRIWRVEPFNGAKPLVQTPSGVMGFLSPSPAHYLRRGSNVDRAQVTPVRWRFLRPRPGRLARCGETRIHCPVSGCSGEWMINGIRLRHGPS